MDLRERRQLDMAAQVARVRARARPWRSIIALVIAIGGAAAAEFGRHARYLDQPTMDALKWGGALTFFLLGTVAAFGLSGQVRNLLEPAIGQAHAGVTRYALVLAGIFAALVISLNLAQLPVGQLVLGGAVTGVLLGIAAQQSLANLFAGLVLLFARPFRVGDRVRFRSGALAGALEGTVSDISITYVRLDTADGSVFVPNSQALAAAVGPIPPPPPPDHAAEPAAPQAAVPRAVAPQPAAPQPGAPQPAAPAPAAARPAATQAAMPQVVAREPVAPREPGSAALRG